MLTANVSFLGICSKVSEVKQADEQTDFSIVRSFHVLRARNVGPCKSYAVLGKTLDTVMIFEDVYRGVKFRSDLYLA